MPRLPTISQSDVDAICQRLLEVGRVPTLRLIIAEHGSGSQTTVQPLLKDWQRRRQAELPAAPESVLSPDLLRILNKQLTHDVQVAKAELQDRLEASEEAASDLARENEVMAAQLAQAEAEAVALGEQNAVLRGQVEQSATDLAQWRERCETEREGRSAAEKVTAVAEAQRDALVRQVDELQRQLAALAAERTQLEVRNTRQSEELMTRRIGIEACNARLEAAARTIDVLREDLANARQAERTAVESAAEMRGMLQVGKGSAGS